MNSQNYSRVVHVLFVSYYSRCNLSWRLGVSCDEARNDFEAPAKSAQLSQDCEIYRAAALGTNFVRQPGWARRYLERSKDATPYVCTAEYIYDTHQEPVPQIGLV
jgi:hypothetical protein